MHVICRLWLGSRHPVEVKIIMCIVLPDEGRRYLVHVLPKSILSPKALLVRMSRC